MITVDISSFLKSLDAVRKRSEFFTVFDDCNSALSSVVVLPIRLPFVDEMYYSNELSLFIGSILMVRNAGVKELVVPYVRNCMLDYEVFDIDRPSLFSVLSKNVYKTPFGILDRRVSNDDEKIGTIVGLTIGPAEFPIGFHAWRNNAESMYVTTLKTLMETTLFIMKNPKVAGALRKAVMKAYGKSAYVDAINEVLRILRTIGKALSV